MSDDELTGLTVAITAIVYAVVLGLAYLVGAILLHFLFRKIGVRPWRAWVPLLNNATLLQVGGYSGWLALCYLVPGVNLVAVVFTCIAYYRIGKGLRMEDVLNILGIVVGFWVIAALVAGKPYDHRLTGATTRQPDQLEEIAAGRLIDPTVTFHQPQPYGQPPAQPYGRPPAQPYGYPQQPQQYGQQPPQSGF